MTSVRTDPPAVLLGSRTRIVPVPARGRPADLIDGRPPGTVFTRREQWASSGKPGLAGWAGRLAAKLAVADLLEAEDLLQIEIVPSGPCSGADRRDCPGPHAPGVLLHGPLRTRLPLHCEPRISISHSRALAVALAVIETHERGA